MLRTSSAPDTSIHNLPTEVLHRILTELQAISGHDLSCLAVCKSWHNLAASMMWENLAFTQRQPHVLLQKLALAGSYLQAVRNLSVTLQAVFVTRSPPDVVLFGWIQRTCGSLRHVRYHHVNQCPEGLRPLVDTMTSMHEALKTGLRQLTSFSLRIHNEPANGPWCACHCDSRLEGVHFSRIIEALPPSCVSLELDSGGFDNQYVTRDMGSVDLILGDHICNALRKLIPQLQHLRLRLFSLCPKFFLRAPERRISGRQYMRSSPCRLWTDEADRYESEESRIRASLAPIGDTGTYLYHNPLFDVWDEWMHKNDRESWKLKHKAETSSPLPADTEQEALPLRTCIINTCLFPNDIDTTLHGLRGEASAAILAQRLYQAKEVWQIFPNLEQCRIISSCFEACDEELNQYYLPLTNTNEISPTHPADIHLGYGETSELIVHDVIQNTTSTVPFKRVELHSWNQNSTVSKLRNQRAYEYKPASSTGQSYLASLDSIEDQIESAWSTAAINKQGPHRLPPTSPPPSTTSPTHHLFSSGFSDSVLHLPHSHFPHDVPETFSGLLDRASIWEERVLHGDRNRYKSWTEMQDMQPLVTRFGQLKRWHGPHDEEIVVDGGNEIGLGEKLNAKDGDGDEEMGMNGDDVYEGHTKDFGGEHYQEDDDDDLFGSEHGE